MKKILMVLIVLLIMIIPNSKVHALEDSFIDSEYIPNTYMVKKRGNSGRYQQMKVFRRKSDNQPVYCIELWEELQTNKNIIGYDNDQYKHANINYSVWHQIMLISYYGYGYDNHTDIKWYAVTQFMIWQVTSPDSDIYFTDTLNGNRITKYENEINEINNLIKNHPNVPSFYNHHYDINYKQPYTITDTNNVLDRFDIRSDGGLEIIKNKNELTVKANRVTTSQVSLINRDKIYHSNPIVYVDTEGQDLLAPGNYYPIYMSVNFKVPTSTIIVNNLDINTNIYNTSDATLEGSKFQLLDIDNKVIQEKEVEKDGKVYFENIGYGTYYLKEIKPGEGYLLNSEIISLEINEPTENINFYNRAIKNKILFTKYVKNPITGKQQLEENAVFSIYNNNEKITTFTTNQNGYYELELPYGNYIVKQEKGLKNHYFVDDFEINISEDNKIQSFELTSDELTANIKIINTDFDSNLPILESGASFEVRNLNNDEKYILNTNDLGNTEYLVLSSGEYEIKQIDIVNGYCINKEVYSFEIGDKNKMKIATKNSNNKYLEITISNKKVKSKVEVEKYTEYYLNDNLIKKELDNITDISIYAKEDIYSKDGIKIYSKDEEVGIFRLEENKVISPLLIFGKYYFNNPIDNTIIEIVLDKMDNKIELLEKVYEYEEIEFEIEDKKQESQIDNNVNEQLEVNTNDIIIEVPNTLSLHSILSDINILLILIGVFFIKRGK